VTWLVDMCAIYSNLCNRVSDCNTVLQSHIYMWNAMCACDMTHWHVWYTLTDMWHAVTATHIHATQHTSDMTHWDIYPDVYVCDMTHWHVCDFFFLLWRICDMQQGQRLLHTYMHNTYTCKTPYEWHDSLRYTLTCIYLPWLIEMYMQRLVDIHVPWLIIYAITH